MIAFLSSLLPRRRGPLPASKVIAVGAGKLNDKGERMPIDVKVGDEVYYGKFGGNEVKVDGEDFLLLRADDIYAIITE